VFVVSCVGSSLATSLSSVQGVLPTEYRIKKQNKIGQGPNEAVEPLIVVVVAVVAAAAAAAAVVVRKSKQGQQRIT
jgi:hypothetical protein